ncbi:MAG TPA: sulfite exporter TauE/SafE family protein, partial [Candidatus Acidoferrales bacterium]
MFITFPALVFTGVPSIIANASSTVALIPGVLASAGAYRNDFRKSENFPFWPLFMVSVAGGIVGALLLLYTPQSTFDSVIPWLLLVATLLIAFGPRISPMLKRVIHIGPVAVVVIQFFIAIYGGYFGGAIGILMLATWTMFGLTDIHVMNANRTLMGAAANSIAAILFIFAHKIWWPQTLVMLLFCTIGGYFGVVAAKQVRPSYVRMFVIMVSASITVVFFLRRH